MTGPAQLLELVAPGRDARKHARRRIDHALDATSLHPVAESVRKVLADAAAAVAARRGRHDGSRNVEQLTSPTLASGRGEVRSLGQRGGR